MIEGGSNLWFRGAAKFYASVLVSALPLAKREIVLAIHGPRTYSTGDAVDVTLRRF